MVTTASATPRTRSADTAVTRPSTTAAAMPASGASGKPIPASTARCETVKPATPASASWTTEIWPTKPVMTTSDSAITMPISEFVSAWRKSNGSTTSATAHRTVDGIARANGCFGRGTSGRRCSTSSPRVGSDAPRRNIAATMSTKTSSSLTPGHAAPWLVGNHDFVDSSSISDSSIPMPRPQAHAIAKEVSLAKRAAASAGTTRNGSVVVSSAATEPAKMPSVPSRRLAITVFASESSFGDRPARRAATSFSDAARVASPKRVQR